MATLSTEKAKSSLKNVNETFTAACQVVVGDSTIGEMLENDLDGLRSFVAKRGVSKERTTAKLFLKALKVSLTWMMNLFSRLLRLQALSQFSRALSLHLQSSLRSALRLPWFWRIRRTVLALYHCRCATFSCLT